MTQLLPQIKAKWADDNNDPLVGGKVYTYVAGTQTPKTTYTDFGGLTANDNPVILNSRGEADIWLTDGEPYKIVVKDSNDVEIYSVDNITGSGGSGGNISLGTVFISALDPVAGFLGDKLSAGDNVTLDIITNAGGDSIQINAVLDGKILASATDTTSGYLFNKITSTDGSVIITDNGTSINLALNPAMLGAENLREVSQGSTNATDSAYTMTDTVDVAFLRPDQSDVMRIEQGTAGNATVTVDGQVVAESADINGTLEADTVNSTGDVNATGVIREGGVSLEDKYLQDAPSDGNQYARKDGAWDIVDTQVGVNVDNYAFNFAASVATTVPTNTGVTFGTSLQLYGSAYRSGDAYEVPADGKYRFITRLIYKGLSNGDYTFSIRWRKNGSAILLVDPSVFYLTESNTGTYDHTLEDNIDFECVAGDLITVEIFNNSTSVSSLEFKGNFLGSKIGSVKGEDGAPGAQNLREIGDGSLNTVDSTYTMTAGANVKFVDPSAVNYLTLNDAGVYRQLDLAGELRTERTYIYASDANKQPYSESPLSIQDYRTANTSSLISGYTETTNTAVVLTRGGGNGAANAMMTLSDSADTAPYTLQLFPSAGTQIPLDIQHSTSAQVSANFADGILVGDATSGTPGNGTIRYNSNDLQGYVNGQWVSLSQGGASGGQVDSVVAGDGISVNAADPLNPIVTNTDHQTTLDTISGTQIQEFSLTLIKDTGSWYVECEQTGGGDLDIIIGGEEKTLVCTPSKARSVTALSLGTATIPSIQYVWIELNAGTPEIHVASTVDRSAPFVMLGVYKLLDDTFTTSDGAFYYQRFNNASNHGVEGRSLLEEMSERVRAEGLKIFRGCEGSTLITTNPAALDGLELGVSAGVIYQLHQQSVSAQTPPNEYFVINDSVTPYKKITNLNQITLDANGDPLQTNGRWYGLDFAISKNSENGAVRIYVFLPAGSYAAKADAINDLFGYSAIAMPIEEQPSIVRMCRMVVGYTNAASGTFTNAITGTATQDQRNFPIGTTGGGTSGGNDFTKYPFIPQTTVPVPVSEGTTYYDVNRHNLIVQSGGDVDLDVGREQWIRGYNNTGATITNGTPVYLNNGTTEGSVIVADIELANSSAKNTCTFVGLATEDIANGSYGEVTLHGIVRDIDTSGFSNGDTVYVSVTSGNLVATPPAFPNYECKVGKVLNVSATEGAIFVSPDVDPPQGSGGIVQAGIETFPICDITDLYTNSVGTGQAWTIGTVVIPTANIQVNYMSCFVTQIGTNQGCRMGIYSPGTTQDTLLGQTVYYSSALVAGINTWAMESPVTLFANTPYLLMLQASTNGTIFGWRDNITNSNGGIQTNRPNHMAVFDYSNNSNPSAGMESPGTRSSSSSRIWLACS